MKSNYIKTGILATLLAVPVFVFLFLYFYGKNHFDLPYIMPEVDESGEVIIVNGDTVFHKIPEFELTDQNNARFSSEKLKGKITVADFFFTRCGTICPKISSELSRVQGVFKDNKDVVLISTSIDPKYDSSNVLNAYAQKYEAITGKWFFLTGDKRKIYDLAINGFKLPVADASEYDSKITDINQTFIHSEKLLLMDKAGYIRGIYDGTNKEDVDRLIVEISVLLESYKTQKKQ